MLLVTPFKPRKKRYENGIFDKFHLIGVIWDFKNVALYVEYVVSTISTQDVIVLACPR
jgi:hypothetical protein